MNNPSSSIILYVVMGFYFVFLYAWPRSYMRKKYGNDISRILAYRESFWMVVIIISILLIDSFTDTEYFADIPIFFIIVTIAWLHLIITALRRQNNREETIFEIKFVNQTPNWLIALMITSGIILVVIAITSNDVYKICITFSTLLLGGAYILTLNKTYRVLFTTRNVYNGAEHFSWNRVLRWHWAKVKDNERTLLVQFDGFFSFMNFKFVRVPVENVEYVGQLFLEYTNSTNEGGILVSEE